MTPCRVRPEVIRSRGRTVLSDLTKTGWRRSVGSLLYLVCALLLLVACGRPSVAVQIAGSTSVQPLLEVLAEAYARQGGGRITVQGVGSTAGIQAVSSGVANLGAISRELSPEESVLGLQPHIIGYDLLTIAVHPTNPVNGLTRDELRQAFAGALRDWSELGGRPGRLHLVSREAGSGSREAFRTLVGPISPEALIQNSAGAIRAAVMNDPGEVGYISLGAARQGGVKLLEIEGRSPEQPDYPLVRPISLITQGRATGEVAAFLRFVQSSAGQRLVAEEGMRPLSP